jgi:hypothetical protein
MQRSSSNDIHHESDSFPSEIFEVPAEAEFEFHCTWGPFKDWKQPYPNFANFKRLLIFR